MNPQNSPWYVLGDFNIIRQDNERKGGRSRLAVALEEFNEWVDYCGLMDMQFSGQSLSWCNGHTSMARSWAHLDCIFFNMATLNGYLDAH